MVAVQDYGVTTGFGEFKDIPVPPEQLAELQRNLAAFPFGGHRQRGPALLDRAGCFPAEVVRATLLIRINAFLRGHSGISEELVDVLAAMFERGVVPLVPARGSLEVERGFVPAVPPLHHPARRRPAITCWRTRPRSIRPASSPGTSA